MGGFAVQAFCCDDDVARGAALGLLACDNVTVGELTEGREDFFAAFRQD